MASMFLSPEERKETPPASFTEKPRDGFKWFNTDRVGDWSDVVEVKPETTVLRPDEKLLGVVKLDAFTKIETVDGVLVLDVQKVEELKIDEFRIEKGL